MAIRFGWYRRNALPPFVSGTEIPRSQLPNQITAVIVMRGNSALARVVQTASQGAAAIDCFDRGGAQRTITHRGDVDDGLGAKCVFSISLAADGFCARNVKVGIIMRFTR